VRTIEPTNDTVNEQRGVSSAEVQLVVILAPPRCFTTVVSAMIGRHPQMYGLPETYLFTSRTMNEWWATHQGSSRTHGLLRAVAQIMFGTQTDATINSARQWLRERPRHSTADIMRALAERVLPLTIVEKTPQATERVDNMQAILSEFPRARFLHLLRHPFGHVLSRVTRRLKNLRKLTPTVELVDAAEQFGGADPQMLWYRCNRNILTFLSRVRSDQQMRVRGEDLLADPDPGLRAITGWLTLRSDVDAIDAMKHPELSPFARFGPRNAPMGGDETFFERPPLRPYSVPIQTLDQPLPWRKDGAGFDSRVKQLARLLGYT
jgi:hypothetical protein